MRGLTRIVFFLLVVISLWEGLAMPATQARQDPADRVRQDAASQEENKAVAKKFGADLVDFASEINSHFSRGVTPQNNAAVLLYQVMGPAPERCPQSDRFFELLGMPRPAEDGDYLHVPAELSESFDAARQGPWRRSDHREFAQWLDENAELLEGLHAATQRPRYFSPLVVPESPAGSDGQPGLFSVLMPGVQHTRTLGRILIARANLALGSGNRRQALDDLLAAYRLGRLVGQGPTLVEGLVGIAIENITVSALPAFLAAPGLTPEELTRLEQGLAEAPPRAEIAEKIEFGERFLLLDFAQTMSRGQTPDYVGTAHAGTLLRAFRFRSLDWDWIAGELNGWYDRLVAALRLETYAERQAAVREIEQELAQLQAENDDANSSVVMQSLKLFVSGRQESSQRVSRVLLQLGLPAISSVVRARDRAEQNLRNVEAAIGLARYRIDHSGAYPKVLVELVPDYLPDLPVDLFAAEPVQYRQEGAGFVLYSVGPNERDDGGVLELPGGGEADVVLRLSR